MSILTLLAGDSQSTGDGPSYIEGIQYSGFIIKLETSYYLYEIISIDRKSLPSVLTSKYTSPETARSAIDNYYKTKS